MTNKHLIRFDWAMKRLLRNKADYTVLEGFLSVVLNETVKIINITDSESNKEHAADKFNRVDILVEDSKGDLLIIEIQNNSEVDYLFRMQYAVAKTVTEHLRKGDRYAKIRKVYHINIVYFKLGDGGDYVYHGIADFRGIHNNNVLQLTKEQKGFFLKENVADIFPEYYILCVRDFNDYAKDSLDEWIYYLKNAEIPEHFTAPGLEKARKALLFDNLSDEDKKAYEYHLDQTRYEQNVVEDAYAEGEAKGEAKGEIKGEAKGRAKEREEMSIETTLKCHRVGCSMEQIIAITGLTKEEIIHIIEKSETNKTN